MDSDTILARIIPILARIIIFVLQKFQDNLTILARISMILARIVSESISFHFVWF